MATTTANLSGVVINEVGTSPSSTFGSLDLNGDGSVDGDDEFIEIYNTSGSAVDISGWQLWIFANGTLMNTSSGNIHQFAPGTTLGAGEHLVVADLAGGTSGTLGIPNAVYADPTVSSATYGVPTFMTLTDSKIVVLYNPDTDEYVQFSGEDSDAADQADVTAQFGSSTLVGSIERGLEDNNGNSAQRSPDGDSNWIDDVQTPGTANLCFAPGTAIATPNGTTLVEKLQIGDDILTASGAVIAVKWIGRQTLQKNRAGARMQPVRITQGALGDGLPSRDLVVTADHGMIMDGCIVNASALVNQDTIAFVPLAALPDTLTYFHIETENHEVILAEGAAAETFVDAATRAAFDNHAEYLDLYGAERVIPEQRLPRITSARMLPDTLKARLGLEVSGSTTEALSA